MIALVRPAVWLALGASPPLTPRTTCVLLQGKKSPIEWGRLGYAAALEKLVESGEAATMEEAAQVLGKQGHAAALQKMVDRGEAATLEEAQQVLSKRGRTATLQKIVDRGEAATLEAAQVGLSMHAGVSSAIKAGKYTRFPGVRWRKDSEKWRVQFSVNGKKVSLGSYQDEIEAARVHDEYVRANQLSRPRHFPGSSEASSSTFKEQVEKASRSTPPTMRVREPSRRSLLGGGAAASLAAATALATALPAFATKSRDGYPVQRPYDAWQAGLSEQQFYILRKGGTEPQFSSPLLREKAKGVFRCAGCDAALFDSSAKFDSGTGWPSFANALPDVEVVSGVGGVAQTAVLGAECRCGRCGGHLGDLFLDGFLFVGTAAMLSGKRYCIDGAALTFAPDSAKDDRVYGEGCVVGKRCIVTKGTIAQIEAARAKW